MTKPGTGALFLKDARSEFISITGSRYRAMADRMKRKKLPELPFTLAEFREHLLLAMGGNCDGAIKCRYCSGYFTIGQIAADHAMPLSRGGSSGLENIEYPCAACNQIKGSMTPDEYIQLWWFLFERLPLARIDVLSRLQKANQLAAGARSNAGVIGELKKDGTWQQARARQIARRKASA